MTNSYPTDPAHLITSEDALRDLSPATHDLAIKKLHDRIDPHTADFIKRSPFVCIGSQSKLGGADVTPRGDPCGFVKILDDQTLLIPDRPGNNRLDTLSNLITNPAIGLLFLIPGFDDTMRVNGTARVTTDPELLALLAVSKRSPTVAILVHVEEVFIHCAKAFRRSQLWDPGARQNRKELPSLPSIIHDQIGAPVKDPDEAAQLDADLEQAYQSSMY